MIQYRVFPMCSTGYKGPTCLHVKCFKFTCMLLSKPMTKTVWRYPVSTKVNINLSSDKETSKDLPSDSEAFEVEQVLSLIISYLGGKNQCVHLPSFVVFLS